VREKERRSGWRCWSCGAGSVEKATTVYALFVVEAKQGRATGHASCWCLHGVKGV
jgi:hypothetical protein